MVQLALWYMVRIIERSLDVYGEVCIVLRKQRNPHLSAASNTV